MVKRLLYQSNFSFKNSSKIRMGYKQLWTKMGQRLRISLKLPEESRNLDAPAKVIRSAEDDSGDPRTIYGAEYIDPPHEFSRVLKKFIHVY